MEIRDYIDVLSKWLWLLILGALLAMTASYLGFRLFTPWPQYEATATVLVSDNSSGARLAPDTLQVMRSTFIQLASRRPVTQQVVDALGLSMNAEDLGERIRVSPVANTQLIEIAAVTSNRELAADIANEVAEQLRLTPATETADQAGTSPIQVLARAEIPGRPRLTPYVGILIAGLLGLLITTGVVLLIVYVDNTVREPADVVRKLGLPILGDVTLPVGQSSVLREKGASKPNQSWLTGIRSLNGRLNRDAKQRQYTDQAVTKFSEECRLTRVNVCHLIQRQGWKPGTRQIIFVTSPEPLTGKPIFIQGLINAWAENDENIAYVRVHNIASYARYVTSSPNGRTAQTATRVSTIESEAGAANQITRYDLVTENRLPVPQTEAGAVAPAERTVTINGDVRHDPVPVLTPTQLREALHMLGDSTQVVIVDGPAVLSSADAAILSAQASTTILLAEKGRTSLEELQDTVNVLTMAGGDVMGVVLLS